MTNQSENFKKPSEKIDAAILQNPFRFKYDELTTIYFPSLLINLEQVPFPGPWVSGPGSRVEQVPFPGPGTRDPSFSGTLGLRSRVPSGASPFSGTWDPGPNKDYKSKVFQV